LSGQNKKVSSKSQNVTAGRKSTKKKAIIYALVVIGVALMLLSAGIGIWKLSQDDRTAKKSDAYDLPSYVFLPESPEGTEIAYRGAIDYPDELGKIPCYCSCGAGSGHKSVHDCFISSRVDDDITFDRHGAG